MTCRDFIESLCDQFMNWVYVAFSVVLFWEAVTDSKALPFFFNMTGADSLQVLINSVENL